MGVHGKFQGKTPAAVGGVSPPPPLTPSLGVFCDGKEGRGQRKGVLGLPLGEGVPDSPPHHSLSHTSLVAIKEGAWVAVFMDGAEWADT